MLDTSISGFRVTRELNLRLKKLVKPQSIVSDNGFDFASQAILRCCQETNIDWHYIELGNPIQNGFVESFNGSFHNECSNKNLFSSPEHIRSLINQWKDDYNHNRPRSSLWNKNPTNMLLKFN